MTKMMKSESNLPKSALDPIAMYGGIVQKMNDMFMTQVHISENQAEGVLIAQENECCTRKV
nr:hypothetical protein [Salipaludibacillus daqingensis]